MFGEDIFHGRKYTKLDDKGRIVIPRFTYVEIADSLVISTSDDYEYAMLFLKKRLDGVVSDLISRQNTLNLEEYKMIQYQLNLIQNYCYDTVSVDKQRRIVIPSEIIKKLNLCDEVYICGGIDYQIPTLRLYRNMEVAEMSINKQKKLLFNQNN